MRLFAIELFKSGNGGLKRPQKRDLLVHANRVL